MKIPFHTLSNFPRLERELRPLVYNLMKLPIEHRKAESKKILDRFNILVDDKFEWCIWPSDKDYTMFVLRWC